jgi:hypothetical protein
MQGYSLDYRACLCLPMSVADDVEKRKGLAGRCCLATHSWPARLILHDTIRHSELINLPYHWSHYRHGHSSLPSGLPEEIPGAQPLPVFAA